MNNQLRVGAFGSEGDAQACRQLNIDTPKIIYMVASAIDVWAGDGDLGERLLNNARDDNGQVDNFYLREVLEDADGALTFVELPKGMMLVGMCDPVTMGNKQFGLVELSLDEVRAGVA